MKKFMKSAVAVLLACLLLIPGTVVFAEEDSGYTLFSDVDYDNDWFAPYVDYCSRYGLVNGMTATTFEPNTSLSRAMFVTILYRSVNAEPSEGAEMPFTDVAESHWAKDAILWAYENGIVNGMTPTTFQPDGKITREQMCTILCRFADAMGFDMTAGEITTVYFEDTEEISEYAFESVYDCATAGIVNGITAFDFGPKQNATRAQACTILQRFFRVTTTVCTETEAEDGKVVFEYADKFGVYAEGYEITDEEGNLTEYYYEEDGTWEKKSNTYEDGEMVRAEYTNSDGYSSTETYAYENGLLTEYRFTDSGGYEQTETYAYNENGDLTEYKYVDSDGYEETETNTYNENGDILEHKWTDSEGYEANGTYTYNENGDLIEHKYMDSDGNKETETYTYNENGDVTEHKYIDSFGYEYTETYTYDEEGKLTKYLYTDTDGGNDLIVYEYNEDGHICSLTRTMDGVVSKAEFYYAEGAEIIDSYVITNSEGNAITVRQGYSEEGYLNSVQYEFTEGDIKEYCTYKYAEDGTLTYVKLEDAENCLESVDGSFVDGLPTELTMIGAEGNFVISIDWDNGIAQITDGETTETDESGMMVLMISLITSVGEVYEEVTPYNAADIGSSI